MKRDDYDRLLIIAEHGDLSPEERLKFIEETEAMADAPGGIPMALPDMMEEAQTLRRSHSAKARYLREAIRLLGELSQAS